MSALQRAGFVFLDLLAVWLVAAIALYIRFAAGVQGALRPWFRYNMSMGGDISILLLYSALIVVFCNRQWVYSSFPPRSAREEWAELSKALGLATLVLLSCTYLSRLNFISWFVMVFTMLGSLLALAARRRLYGRHWHASFGSDGRNVAIVGQGHQAQAIHDALASYQHAGYVLKGVLNCSAEQPCGLRADPVIDSITDSNTGSIYGSAIGSVNGSILGSVADLQAVVRGHFIDEIVICHPDREVVKSVADEAQKCGVGVHIIPDLYDGLVCGAPVAFFGRFPAIYLPQPPKPVIGLMLKRWLDAFCSIMALLLISPTLLLIALAIKLDTPGPVIYASTRIGRKGKRFRCYKFRTMTADAEALKLSLQHLNVRDAVLFKIANDPRITRIGRILRKYSLDELPQFWNVLKGDMSMVGPRPPLADEVQQYEPDHLRRLDVLPGMTGLWQVESRSDPSFARYISLDVQYVERWHLLMDIKILFRTIAVVFAGGGE